VLAKQGFVFFDHQSHAIMPVPTAFREQFADLA
jgi:hypothetical protein